jgi:hypothetical protein
MKYRTRHYYTDSGKALMWDRWKQVSKYEYSANMNE